MKEEIDAVISDVINRTEFINGRYVNLFEEHFSVYHEAKHCIGVANGTDALEIAIESLNLPPKSEIIVPANSFIASSEAVTRSGHSVVFCDVNKDNYTISTSDIRSKITQNTKAIVVVHLYGHPCDMDEIIKLSKEFELKVIEDCAQAHGAEYKGKKIGAVGNIGAFSFYPGKNLGAFGDAGAIVTNDENLAIRCKMIANHGRIAKYDHQFEGRNSRLDNLQAAVLTVKLKYLEQQTESRISVANYYYDHLADIESIILPKKEIWARHVYHLFVIQSEDRDNLKDYLLKNGIQVGVHYPISLPKLEAYNYLGKVDNSMYANNVDSSLLSLPIGSHISSEDVSYIASIIRSFYGK